MQLFKTTTDKLNAKVADVMSTKVQTVQADTSVKVAIELMVKHNLRRILVVSEQKRLVGVLSQRDILKHYFSPEQEPTSEDGESSDPRGVQALVARDKPIVVSPGTPLIKAAVVLATNKVGCLPVVGTKQKLIGLLTITDLFRHMAGHNQSSPMEAEFEFCQAASNSRPETPAYIRTKSRELVIPVKWLNKRDAMWKFAVLGYDREGQRILVKFIDDVVESQSAVRIRRSSEHLVIPANEFIANFNLLNGSTIFDVACHDDSRYLILTPRTVERS